MKLIVAVLGLLLCTVGNAQEVKKRIPFKNGVTHHSISEDKIELMRSANLVKEKIIKYKTRKKIGYGLCVLGAGAIYYACDHMKVPQYWYSKNSQRYIERNRIADKRRDRRRVVAILGAATFVTGSYIIWKNHKLLRRIEFNLSPTTGGLKFYW